MAKKKSPKQLWDHALELESYIWSNTAHDIYMLMVSKIYPNNMVFFGLWLVKRWASLVTANDRCSAAVLAQTRCWGIVASWIRRIFWLMLDVGGLVRVIHSNLQCLQLLLLEISVVLLTVGELLLVLLQLLGRVRNRWHGQRGFYLERSELLLTTIAV